jgi:hypothetical protein
MTLTQQRTADEGSSGRSGTLMPSAEPSFAAEFRISGVRSVCVLSKRSQRHLSLVLT